jgi:hypothetical protein
MNIEQFFKDPNVNQQFNPPFHNSPPLLKEFYTYKGQDVSPHYIDIHPELHHLYPSQAEIEEKRQELLRLTNKGKISFFTVTEDGFKDIYLNIFNGNDRRLNINFL